MENNYNEIKIKEGMSLCDAVELVISIIIMLKTQL